MPTKQTKLFNLRKNQIETTQTNTLRHKQTQTETQTPLVTKHATMILSRLTINVFLHQICLGI